MQFIKGFVLCIILCIATFIVAHCITAIIGYDGMIVYCVAYAVAILSLCYIYSKHKSNKEKNLIKNWSQNGYKSAITMLNTILPEDYCINRSEESIFERIFDGGIDEAKKQHFDNNANDTDNKLLKTSDLWLLSILQDFCANHCSWDTIKEGQIQMLKYVGEYSEQSPFPDQINYYDKYEFTPSGIVAEKIMLANAVLTDDPNSKIDNVSKFKNFIDKGYVSEFKKYERNDNN